jgi:hypothetical protein
VPEHDGGVEEMTDLDAVWIDGYVRAWNSNDPAEIGALFTADAVYRTEPHTPPWRGRAQIVENWLASRDEPGETSFEWHPLLITPDVAILEGTTTYPDRRYSNLWVIRLDTTRLCREFTEWWMRHPDAS